MTQEAALFLEKARTLLDHADIMLSVKLNDEAGRRAGGPDCYPGAVAQEAWK